MNEMDVNQLFRMKLTLELENRGVQPHDALIITEWLPDCLVDDAISKFVKINDFIEEMWGRKI